MSTMIELLDLMADRIEHEGYVASEAAHSLRRLDIKPYYKFIYDDDGEIVKYNGVALQERDGFKMTYRKVEEHGEG